LDPAPSAASYELVICTEVAEHIPAEHADVLVRKLCKACAVGGAIVFTAAPPGQGGHDHINEQPFSYWEDKFGAEGFAVDREKTEQLKHEWLRLEHMPWYAQNVRVLRPILGRPPRSPSEVRELMRDAGPMLASSTVPAWAQRQAERQRAELQANHTLKR